MGSVARRVILRIRRAEPGGKGQLVRRISSLTLRALTPRDDLPPARREDQKATLALEEERSQRHLPA